MRPILLFSIGYLLSCAPAHAQATSRPCDVAAKADQPGPACLAGHIHLGRLQSGDLYWHINKFDTEDLAKANDSSDSLIAEAFGKYWVFSVGPKKPMENDTAEVGPLPLETRDGDFHAEILQSTFSPGMTAPIHVHSGPEAFYAVSGDTCLESPDGVQIAKGPASSLIIRQGPPMLLMATGHDLRRGFALILHDGIKPPTTLVHDWIPQGLCKP
jgi:quercetin dioxygenase-like cupin family protein